MLSLHQPGTCTVASVTTLSSQLPALFEYQVNTTLSPGICSLGQRGSSGMGDNQNASREDFDFRP